MFPMQTRRTAVLAIIGAGFDGFEGSKIPPFSVLLAPIESSSYRIVLQGKMGDLMMLRRRFRMRSVTTGTRMLTSLAQRAGWWRLGFRVRTEFTLATCGAMCFCTIWMEFCNDQTRRPRKGPRPQVRETRRGHHHRKPANDSGTAGQAGSAGRGGLDQGAD